MTHFAVKPPGIGAAAKKRAGRCITPRCVRSAHVGRSICNVCRDRKWRSAHPEHHLWNNLKKSAKRRGITFVLTLPEFKSFCLEHDFVALVGRGMESATVDRRDPRLGYSADNIRPLSNRENATLGGVYGNERKSERYTAEEDPLG